jgi:hypothetical protein
LLPTLEQLGCLGGMLAILLLLPRRNPDYKALNVAHYILLPEVSSLERRLDD